MKQELNTILAALRFYQEHGQGDPANRTDAIHAIATGGGEDISMDSAGIDDLCKRLNAGPNLYVYVQVYLKSGASPEPAFDYTFVQADEEGTAYLLGQRDLSRVPDYLREQGYAPANDYVVAVGPMLQPAHMEDSAVLVTVAGGVAEVISDEGACVRVIDHDNIDAGDGPTELPRDTGFEELLAGVGLRDVLDHVDSLFPEHRDPDSGLCLMNGHFVRKQKQKKAGKV